MSKLFGIRLNPTTPVKRSTRLQDQSRTKATAALKVPLSHKKNKIKAKNQSPKEATAALKVPLSNRKKKNNVDDLPTSDNDEELHTNLLESIKTEIIEIEDEDEDPAEESDVLLAEKKSRKVLVVQKPNNAKDLEMIKNSTKPKNKSRVCYKKALNCSKCDQLFYKPANLEEHKRDVHGKRKQSMVYELPKEQQAHPCTFEGCDDNFKTKRHLAAHIKITHSDAASTDLGLQEVIEHQISQLNTEINKNLICHHCAKKFSSRWALHIHLKRHLQIKAYICKKCGAAKVTPPELVEHMRSHEDTATFKCPLCPYLLKHKNAVARHVRLIHKCTFKCPLCPKLMKHKNAIERHVRLKHKSVANK